MVIFINGRIERFFISRLLFLRRDFPFFSF